MGMFLNRDSRFICENELGENDDDPKIMTIKILDAEINRTYKELPIRNITIRSVAGARHIFHIERSLHSW